MTLSINWRSGLYSLLLFAYPALLPLSFTAADQPLLLLSVLGLYGLLTQRPKPSLSTIERNALAGLGLLALAGLASLLHAGASSRQMVPYLCPLLALLFFPLARSNRLRSAVAWWALVVGLLMSAGYATWQVAILHMPRAVGHHFPNTYGALALLMLAPLLGAWPILGRQGASRLGLAIGIASGLTTIVLSGSRGVWLVAIALGVWRFSGHSYRRRLLVLTLAALVLLATLTIPELAARWQAAQQDLQLYGQGNADSSIGLRFVMWRAAWEAWLAHPLLGLGLDGFAPWLAAMAQRGDGPQTLLQHGHAHNDLLNALATGGLLGLLGLLAALYLPWRAFRQRASLGGVQQQAAARAGQLLVLGIALLGLSDTMFVHRFLLTWYAVSVVLLLAWSGQPEQD
ncbi:O-antigen ligase family protein [Chitinimonas sp.]|uniref:O-antigen ligase family protein n=1 Tax=Chitinimonas sp. TaxID=1934313 RepID=UPI002F92DCD7